MQTTQDGDKGKITVEALNKDSAFLNFLSSAARSSAPDMKPQHVRLVQTGPGHVRGRRSTPTSPGNYVAVLNYRGAARARAA